MTTLFRKRVNNFGATKVCASNQIRGLKSVKIQKSHVCVAGPCNEGFDVMLRKDRPDREISPRPSTL